MAVTSLPEQPFELGHLPAATDQIHPSCVADPGAGRNPPAGFTARRPGFSSSVRLVPGAEGAGEDGDAVASAALGEDGLEVVLDGVLGQCHLAGHRSGVAAGGQQAEQLGFAVGEAVGAAEQLKSLGGGCFLDRDDEGCRAVRRRTGCRLIGGEPAARRVSQKPSARWVRVNAG
jgi:hypothetical protein